MFFIVKVIPNAYCCNLKGFPTALRCATGQCDVIGLLTGINWCTTAEFAWLTATYMTLYEWKDVCWCMSQSIPGIIPESDANYQCMWYCFSHYSCFIDSQKGGCAVFRMSKRTNLQIKDAPCLHFVHFLQHPTSRPTTMSTQTTMVNALEKNFSPLPEGRYRKSTKWSIQRWNQANHGKSTFEAERVWALGALRRLRTKKKLAA